MKLDAISIVTANMPAAVRFYSALGLELADGGPEAPHSEFSSGSIRLLLDTEQVMLSIDPEWTWPTGGHKMSLAFDCTTAEAVDATFAQLTRGGAEATSSSGAEATSSFGSEAATGAGAEGGGNAAAAGGATADVGGGPVAGVVSEPWDAFWGQRYAVISDPDGNTVDLFATL